MTTSPIMLPLAQQSYLPSFLQSLHYSPLPDGNTPNDANHQRKPSVNQVFRSKRLRVVLATFTIVIALAYIYAHPARFRTNFQPSNVANVTQDAHDTDNTDWSRFAYTQYVTNVAYLCNSVMIFEQLHRLGSKADRLMMYPDTMEVGATVDTIESRLLHKARDEYGVKLKPIQVQHRDGGEGPVTWADSYTKLLAFNQTQYDRVLSLDSDSSVLKSMDELFFLPPSPVAMPRAYWLDKPYLSSQLIVIQPAAEEFKRIEDAIHNAGKNDFDMEIVNNLYEKDCIIIPHRRYDLITGEFRGQSHASYLGNTYEKWDPEQILAEASFLHFSDWPVPKPWLTPPQRVVEENQPKCEQVDGQENCRARDLWLGFYSDFRERRQRVCDLVPTPVKRRKRSIDTAPKSWEFKLK